MNNERINRIARKITAARRVDGVFSESNGKFTMEITDNWGGSISTDEILKRLSTEKKLATDYDIPSFFTLKKSNLKAVGSNLVQETTWQNQSKFSPEQVQNVKKVLEGRGFNAKG